MDPFTGLVAGLTLVGIVYQGEQKVEEGYDKTTHYARDWFDKKITFTTNLKNLTFLEKRYDIVAILRDTDPRTQDGESLRGLMTGLYEDFQAADSILNKAKPKLTPSGSTHASAPAQQQTGQESHQWPSWTKGIRRRLRGHDQGSSLAEIEHISAAAAATSLASDTVVNTVQETEEKLQRAQKNTGLWHILKGLVKWSNRLDNIQDRIKTKLEEYHSWLSNYKPVIHRHVDQTDSVVASSPSEAALLLLDLHQIYQKTNNVASSSQVMLDIRLDSSRKDRLRRLLANCGAAVVRDPLPFYLFVFYRVPRDVSATARIADEIAVQSLYKTTLEKLPNPGPPRVTHFDSDANDRKKYCLDGQTVVECGWLTRATSPTTSSRSTGAPSPPAILHFAYHIEQHRQPAADREPAALDYWSSFAAGHTSFCLSY